MLSQFRTKQSLGKTWNWSDLRRKKNNFLNNFVQYHHSCYINLMKICDTCRKIEGWTKSKFYSDPFYLQTIGLPVCISDVFQDDFLKKFETHMSKIISKILYCLDELDREHPYSPPVHRDFYYIRFEIYLNFDVWNHRHKNNEEKKNIENHWIFGSWMGMNLDDVILGTRESTRRLLKTQFEKFWLKERFKLGDRVLAHEWTFAIAVCKEVPLSDI